MSYILKMRTIKNNFKYKNSKYYSTLIHVKCSQFRMKIFDQYLPRELKSFCFGYKKSTLVANIFGKNKNFHLKPFKNLTVSLVGLEKNCQSFSPFCSSERFEILDRLTETQFIVVFHDKQICQI